MFVYYLLATTGICAVPLSSFHTHWQGLRLTLLEQDESKFEWICHKIQQAFEKFYNTTPHLNAVDLNLLENKFLIYYLKVIKLIT